MEQTAVVFEKVARLADAALIVGLQRWVRADRSLTARLLVHLGEVDARGLYRERAWPSMFAYAVKELRMSESEAYARIAAARLGRQFPRVIELVAQGALHLTAIKLLGPHLTADNHVQVLERARGKSAREIELIVAELAPQPDAPSRIRKLPAPGSARTTPVPQQRGVNAASVPMFAERPAETTLSPAMSAGAAQLSNTTSSTQMFAEGSAETPSSSAMLAVAVQSDATAAPSAMSGSATQFGNTASSAPMFGGRATETESSAPACAVAAQSEVVATAFRFERGAHPQFQLEPAPRKVSSTTPLRPGRYKVEFTAGEAMYRKLEQLKALLRHQVPNGDLATILERAADLLLEKTRKQRFAQTTRSRVSKAQPGEPRAQEAGRSAAGADEARASGAGAHDEMSKGAPGAREVVASAAGGSAAGASATSSQEMRKGAAVLRESVASAAPHAGEAGGSAPRAGEAGGSAMGASTAGARKVRANEVHGIRSGGSDSRYVPRSVVREVYARDGEQCTFVSADGRRCPERGFLERHHHDTPYARGGEATTENLRTVCRAHNALFAERDFGRAFIRSKLLHARLQKRGGANELVLRRERE